MTRHHAKKYLRAAALVAALIFSGNGRGVVDAGDNLFIHRRQWDGEYPMDLWCSTAMAQYTAHRGRGPRTTARCSMLSPRRNRAAPGRERALPFRGGSDGRNPARAWSSARMARCTAQLTTADRVLRLRRRLRHGVRVNAASPQGGAWTTSSCTVFLNQPTERSRSRDFRPERLAVRRNLFGGTTSPTCRRIGCGTVFELTRRHSGAAVGPRRYFTVFPGRRATDGPPTKMLCSTVGASVRHHRCRRGFQFRHLRHSVPVEAPATQGGAGPRACCIALREATTEGIPSEAWWLAATARCMAPPPTAGSRIIRGRRSV